MKLYIIYYYFLQFVAKKQTKTKIRTGTLAAMQKVCRVLVLDVVQNVFGRVLWRFFPPRVSV